MADPITRATEPPTPTADGETTPDASTRPTGPASPGERRLDHPPSDRYRVAEIAEMPLPDQAASRARGILFGVVAGLAGSIAITLLGGALAVTAGLLVVASTTGWAIGIGLRAGGGARVDRGARVRLALTLSVAAVALGQLGLWAYARSEGGVLAPLEYLWDVFGPLVPLEVAAGSISAWVAAR